MEGRAQHACTPLVGGVLVIAGIIGFFYEASFDTAQLARDDDVFGILAVNGWHNLVHIPTGLLGLLSAPATPRATLRARASGSLYVVLAIWGFIVIDDGDRRHPRPHPVNTEDNFLHLILGLIGLAAGAATPEARGAAPSRRA